jgi:hypothetical protein
MEAANMLYPSEGRQAANIKFYSGWDRVVCADRLAAQFLSVEAQVRDGKVERRDGIDD